ncbi:unnamed protein product [Rhizoctonia solani]|uniref:F-box domain-containing protein n=1 Tax=Rhizoctonia solani TaxID=456999 RepID=A0A8H3BIF4_9AGAM|nr:unnamed protein product [Rhizoctonia solani]
MRMGKVTTYCQISGCSPEVDSGLDYIIEDILDDASEPASDYKKVREALGSLSTEDESRGTQALSIIGPIGQDNKPIREFDESFNTLDEILAEAEGHVRELSGCYMGELFDLGYCEGPDGGDDSGALVSYGGYFFVQTMMIAILAGATQGRVSVQRLWKLAMMKGYYDPHNHYVLPGVDYGPIHTYLDQFPWYLGDVAGRRELLEMEKYMGTVEDIAEVLRKRGFWMWMRPDRFPIDPVITPRPITDITEADLIAPISHELISKLPTEIVRSVALELNIRDIITLATLNKTLYYRVLGNQNTRDSLARAYIHENARWCLTAKPSSDGGMRGKETMHLGGNI